MLATLLAAPGVRGLDRLEDRVFGAALRTFGRDELRDFGFRVVDDLLRDGFCGNGFGLFELVGGDEDARIHQVKAGKAEFARRLNPAV